MDFERSRRFVGCWKRAPHTIRAIAPETRRQVADAKHRFTLGRDEHDVSGLVRADGSNRERP